MLLRRRLLCIPEAVDDQLRRQATRAIARAVSAEMHAGFVALRTHMAMNIRASKPGSRNPEVEKDIRLS